MPALRARSRIALWVDRAGAHGSPLCRRSAGCRLKWVSCSPDRGGALSWAAGGGVADQARRRFASTRCPLRRLHLDPPWTSLLGLGNAHGQNTVVQLGLDLLGVRLAGQRDAVVESARTARAPAEDSLALAFLDLAGDREL